MVFLEWMKPQKRTIKAVNLFLPKIHWPKSDILFMFQSDRFSRSGSVLSDIHESGIITDFSPPLSISSSGASYHPSLSPSSMSSSVATAPIRPRRRSGKDRNSLIDNQLHYGVADDIGYWFTFNHSISHYNKS